MWGRRTITWVSVAFLTLSLLRWLFGNGVLS